MNKANQMKGDYGIDAPLAIRHLIIAGVTSIIAGIALHSVLASARSLMAVLLLVCGLLVGGCTLAMAALLVWSSKVGKLQFRDSLIDSLALRGTETVLDVGCGRGLLLIAAARRLTAGKAVGIDLWRSMDQSGNHPESTLANAKAEGVANLVELNTADMRELPVGDRTVDVAVSSLAIHNIPDERGREIAIRELSRVLKPGGRIALVDIHYTAEYARTLHELGWHDVRLSGLQFRILPPVRVVTGRKPT
jgi:ubiquinone/menaquinone biosynthesis C-methylase UbiE